jgi:hypothetical protein
MGTNCAYLLAQLFLFSAKKNEKKLARFVNFTFRYTDNVLLAILSFIKHSWDNSFSLSQWGIVVKRVEKSNFLSAIARGEGS